MTESARPSWFPAVDRRSVLTFVALVVLLLGPWPGYGHAFRGFFSGFANGVVRVLGIGGTRAPHFAAPTPADLSDPEVGDWTVMLSGVGAGGDQTSVPLDLRIIAYTPLAVFLALVLATPVARRRKLIVLGTGLAFLLARLAVAIALPVARAFDASRPSWAVGPVAELTWWTLITPPVMSYATPLMVWWVALAATLPPRPTSERTSSGRAGRPRRTARRRAARA